MNEKLSRRRREHIRNDYDATIDLVANRLHLAAAGRRIEVSGWPNPAAFEAVSPGRFLACRPKLSIVQALKPITHGSDPTDDAGQVEFLFDKQPSAIAALRAYWLSYPAAVVRTLSAFHSKHSFHLAQWCSAGGQELLERLPALGMAAALLAPEGFPDLVQRNDADLYADINPLAEDVDRGLGLLRRVPATAAAPKTLKTFRFLLTKAGQARRDVKHLTHASRITYGVLSLFRDSIRPFCVQPSLIAEVSARRAEDLSSETADKVEYALHLHRVAGEPERIRFNWIREIDAFIESSRDNARIASSRSGQQLPPPPLSGISTRMLKIQPILTAEALEVEGRVMKNCVGTLAYEAMRGETCFYRMLSPERATIRLVPQRPRSWVLGDARCDRNLLPHASTLTLIAYWLSREQDIPLREAFGNLYSTARCMSS
jgi:hypothetical protein